MRSIPLRGRSRRMIIGFGAVGGLAVGLSSCAASGHPAATAGSHPTKAAGSHPTTTSAPPGTATSAGPQSQIPTTTTSAASATGAAALLAPGDYLDASGAVPHYLLAIAPSAPGTLQGTLTFVFQDGKQSQVFTFTASPGTSAGSAPFPLVTSPGTTHATATITAGTLTLPGCQSYLNYALSASQCAFTAAGG
jgi:hypothetical protein